jgi:hypothetical protein
MGGAFFTNAGWSMPLAWLAAVRLEQVVTDLQNLLPVTFAADQLREVTVNPIKFRAPKGKMAYRYEATVLADICDAVLLARKARMLQKQQLHIADQCEILMRGFARVGIIALVDEVTGYQEFRRWTQRPFWEIFCGTIRAFAAQSLDLPDSAKTGQATHRRDVRRIATTCD